MYVSKDKYGKPFWFKDECWVAHKDCPWRSCFNAHDCGYTNSRGDRVVMGHCATNYNNGCPNEWYYVPCCDNPMLKPNKGTQRTKCKNCGTLVPVHIAKKLNEV